jgi:ubiquinone/menaquinone biosynthesis C-methylase UbiE
MLQQWNAKEYRDGNEFQTSVAREILRETKIFQTNAAILDVGCGDGTTTAFIAREIVPDGFVTGIDSSADMINYAQLHHKEKNITFRQCNATECHLLGSSKFDGITSFFVLHWIPSQISALKAFSVVLKPGGNLLLVLPLKCPQEYIDIIKAMENSPHWKDKLNSHGRPRWRYDSGWTAEPHWWEDHPEETYGTFLHTTGFTAQSIRQVPVPHQFRTRSDLAAFVRPIIPHLKQLDKTDAENFLSELCDAFLQRIGTNTNIPWNSKVLVIQAEKRNPQIAQFPT